MDFAVDIDAISVSSPINTPTEIEVEIPSSTTKEKRGYSWLSKVSTINLELVGSDLAQRIEISCPSGPRFKTELGHRKDENGDDLPDQKQFSLLSQRNEKLLTLDFSKDHKSFHILEPDSDTFIAFFTCSSRLDNCVVRIQNVIDEEIYSAVPCPSSPLRMTVKSQKGEELGIISRSSLKWTQFLRGSMTLNFTGDEREGLNSREKAVLLGFLIALGLFGLDYWKRSSSGLLTFYILSILLFSIFVIFLYTRFREEGGNFTWRPQLLKPRPQPKND